MHGITPTSARKLRANIVHVPKATWAVFVNEPHNIEDTSKEVQNLSSRIYTDWLQLLITKSKRVMNLKCIIPMQTVNFTKKYGVELFLNIYHIIQKSKETPKTSIQITVHKDIFYPFC